MASEVSASLVPHPDGTAAALRAITVIARREAPALLCLRYRLEGELAGLRVPPPAAGGFALGLWQHTCFEAFIAAEGARAYHEINLSPSGEWAAFAFSAYREINALDVERIAPRLATRTGAGGLELDATLRVDALSPAYVTAPLRLNLAAVVESAGGALSYWSLAHRPGRPDFHREDSRSLRLVAPSAGGER
jgi:hypothetical protein